MPGSGLCSCLRVHVRTTMGYWIAGDATLNSCSYCMAVKESGTADSLAPQQMSRRMLLTRTSKYRVEKLGPDAQSLRYLLRLSSILHEFATAVTSVQLQGASISQAPGPMMHAVPAGSASNPRDIVGRVWKFGPMGARPDRAWCRNLGHSANQGASFSRAPR